MPDNLEPGAQPDNSSPAAEPAAEPKGDPSLLAETPIASTDPADLTTTTGDPGATTVTITTPQAAWYDALPEDMKSNPNIQKFKNQEDMAKSYLELSSLLGHEKVPIPKDENDTAAINHLNKVLGVPDEPTGYTFEETQVPEGFEGMDFGDDMFKTIAHKHKLTPAQAQGMKNDYIALLGQIREDQIKQLTEATGAAKNELMKEWGLAFDSKVKLAQQVMNKFAGSKEAFDHINARIGSDPVALKFLAKVGENFAEGALGDLGTHTSTFTKTPADAKKEYDQIMNDPNDIYWAGVRNNQVVSESVRKERVAYVESLLRMQQPITTSA